MDLEQEIKDNKILMVLFVSSDCRHCMFVEDSPDWFNNINKRIVINVTNKPEFIKKYSLRSTPTLLVFENGVITVNAIGQVMCENYLKL